MGRWLNLLTRSEEMEEGEYEEGMVRVRVLGEV